MTIIIEKATIKMKKLLKYILLLIYVALMPACGEDSGLDGVFANKPFALVTAADGGRTSISAVIDDGKRTIRLTFDKKRDVDAGELPFQVNPGYAMVSPKEPEKIDYVIANCAECEPYLTSDYRRMIENPELLIGGMKVLLRIFPHAKGVIAVEDNKKDAIEYLEEAAKDEPNIQVVALKTKYPQGAERMLIYAVTGRKLNSSMLPADVGCVVDNCDTVVSLYRAAVQGRPLMHRIVTVTGDAVQDPRNFSVCTGTSYRELLEAAGGLKTEPEKIISGGPMMGFGLYSLDVPVTKTSSALLCMTKDEVSRYEETACINCGRCVEACPEQLLPSRLADASVHHREAWFEQHNGLECCECGCCSYVCPARRPLTQYIKSMRKIILGKKKKK